MILGVGAFVSPILAKEHKGTNKEDKMTQELANESTQALNNAKKNPFGLVYEGAISKNEANKVQIHPVSYTNKGLKLAANLYTPANFKANKKYPALVIAHPNGGVKEQVAGLYAQKMAERGYITLAFDSAYQGASEGLPRNVDIPANRTEDIRAALDFLEKQSGVDREKLGIIGICGGGGYTLKAAQSDKRFKAVATLSMFDTGLVRRNGFLDSELNTIQERLEKASKARQEEALTGKVSYIGAAPKKLSEAELAKISTDLYREGMVYYGDTHAHPNSTFAYTTSSLLDLMSFNVSDNIELLNQPLLMIVGDKADTAYMSERIFKLATKAQDKKLIKLKNATHIQTYYRSDLVEAALESFDTFFKEKL
ncbi:alpha/beta hydrolase [Campylobacter sp. MIT 12-8780]|nr:alpha/beta hydrolase [Campylobacter sp. MIT 19-121]TQR41672.1 alpha/beta hydrolase [Campylobacter sp. MIT 12-8780]